MNQICIEHKFHSVGQGLFSSGYIQFEGCRKFYWVFDCGSISHHERLRQEIQQFQNDLEYPNIDLFCISHFDKDHVNGATELLRTIQINVLVLPYFSIAERMLLAARQGASDEYLQFLVHPASYLIDVSINKNIRIIFIDGEESQRVSNRTSSDISPDTGHQRHDPENPTLKIPIGIDMTRAELYLAATAMRQSVEIVSHKEPFRLGSNWEFVFYNERRSTGTIEYLERKIIEKLKQHKRTDGTYDGQRLVADLTTIYGDSLGSTATAKNRISLVMYTGLVQERCDIKLNWRTTPVNMLHQNQQPPVKLSTTQNGFSTLHTGDVFLNTSKKLDTAFQHFGKKRWDTILLLQVPHHGAYRSWFKGAATKFSHQISIFTAKSSSKQHPSRSVLTDLINHGPQVVNENIQFTLNGYLTTHNRM